MVALVTFDDDAEALRCDRRLSELRSELHLPFDYEFHFARNPKRLRVAFLQAVQPFSFGYHVFALDKLDELTFKDICTIKNLYLHSAKLLVDNARPFLRDVTLIIDRRGDRKLRSELSRQLRNYFRSDSGEFLIRRIKQQDSHRNNLLQLADYVASIEGRALSEKTDGVELQDNYLKRREITRLAWTK